MRTGRARTRRAAIAVLLAGMALSPMPGGPARAQDGDGTAPSEMPDTAPPELADTAPADAAAGTPTRRASVGSVTNLPLPRYVSLKSDEGNVRRGPSLSHRIDWVLTRRGMPLRLTDEFGHWRRVQDRDGLGGWIHYSLLSGNRTVIVAEDMTGLMMKPSAEATVSARAEAGVIARLEECTPDWCRIRADGRRGWVPRTALWGIDPGEVRN